jgi:hypothetical protein
MNPKYNDKITYKYVFWDIILGKLKMSLILYIFVWQASF